MTKANAASCRATDRRARSRASGPSTRSGRIGAERRRSRARAARAPAACSSRRRRRRSRRAGGAARRRAGRARSSVTLFLLVLSPEKIRTALTSLRLRDAQAGEQARAVGPRRRLDVDHLGAEQRRARGATSGPGPERGQVEDPQALERQRAPSAPAPGARRRPVARRSRSTRRARRAAAPAPAARSSGGSNRYGGPGSTKPSRGFATNDAARREVVGRRDRRAVADRRVRDAERRRELEDSAVVRSAIHAAIVGAQVRRGRRRASRSSIHSGWSTITQKSSHCWPVPHAEPDQAVAGAPRRPGVEIDRPLRNGPPDHVDEGHRVVGEAQHERLEHRHVDELAGPVAARGPRRHRADGGVDAGEPLADLAADVHRRPVGRRRGRGRRSRPTTPAA